MLASTLRKPRPGSLPGATATQVDGNQIQLPDGTWVDPRGFTGDANPAAQPGGVLGRAPVGGFLAKPNAGAPINLGGTPTAAPAPVASPAPVAQGDGSEVTLPEISTVIPQTANGAGGGMMRKGLGAYLEGVEQRHGLPAGYLAKTRAIESSNGTNLVNPNSSARGDFQFIRSTARQMGLKDPMDPYASADAAGALAAQNKAAFVKAQGREPTGAELYGMHQQGSGGYLTLMRGGRTGEAEMNLNGGRGLSGSQMVAKINGMYDRAKPANLGEGFVPNIAPSTGGGMMRTDGGGNPTPTAGPPAPNAEQAAQMAKDNTYKGGLLGLLGFGDQNAAGMGKDVLGKLGDMTAGQGGGAIGQAVGALGKLAGGGQQQTQQPGITLHADNSVYTGNPALMSYLDPRRRRGMVVGG